MVISAITTQTKSKKIDPTGEFPFYIEPRLMRKLDLLIKRLEKKDVWILVTGDEGSGKTNTAAYLAYYFHVKTGRPLKIENFFFDAEELFAKAKTEKEQIYNWDEAALGGLSSEWWSEAQRNLLKFAIVGRKKHHIFIMCIPRFDKLKEDLRADRIHAHIHMWSGWGDDKEGHFMYFTRRGIKLLNEMFKRQKIRKYSQAMQKGGFSGYIPYVFDKIFTPEEVEYYEKKKDEAIENIGSKRKKINEEKIKAREELRRFKYKLAHLEFPINSKVELARKLGFTANAIREWSYYQLDENNKANG